MITTQVLCGPRRASVPHAHAHERRWGAGDWAAATVVASQITQNVFEVGVPALTDLLQLQRRVVARSDSTRNLLSSE